MSTPAYYTVAVPALGCVNLASTGRAVKIKDAGGPLYLQIGGGSKFPVKRGSAHATAEMFTLLTLFNETAAAISASLYVGDTIPEDLLETESTVGSVQIRGNGDAYGLPYRVNLVADPGTDYVLELDNGEQLNLPGVDAEGRRRKHIVITNYSTTLDLTIKKNSAGGKRIGAAFPRLPLILELDADLCISNLSGSDGLQFSVLETFHTAAVDAATD